MQHIRAVAPEVPVIYDAKRGDIGSTNQGYADHAFDELRADAITVHPYLGREALEPFLARPTRARSSWSAPPTLVAASSRTSWSAVNRSTASWRVASPKSWNGNGNCAVVVGATYPDELAAVRRIVGDMPILIPGIGAQGGDLRRTVEAGRDARGRGMIINSSRGVIYASKGDDFAEAARQEVLRLNREIDSYR